MPLTIAVCEDNEEQCAALRRLLDLWSSDKPFALVIDEYISAEAFLFAYPEKSCDLLILDIEMGEINGMELARRLREKADMLPVLFVTGFSDYMNEGYEVEALHYLLKPVDKDKLFGVLDRYIKNHRPEKEIILKSENETLRLPSDSIAYCEAMGKKTSVFTADGSSTECDLGINDVKNLLPEEFIFTHRSYIVNLRYVKSIRKTELVLDSGAVIPVSRRLYKDINEKFIGFYTES